MNSPFSLHDKTILVTGASSGIGRSTAIECSKLGANLILTGRKEEELQNTISSLKSGEHKFIVGDLTLREDLEKLITQLTILDGIVLCAGKGLLSLIQFSDQKKFDELFSINFFSQIELLKNILKKKLIKKGSSIVAVSSVAGNGSFTIGNGIYGASKAALNSYMKFCAKELSPKGIRVNTVLPGIIDTPFIHQNSASDDSYQKIKDSLPLKRFGKPEEVAYAIIYLLSDASSWVTGTSLVIDGGRSLV